MSSPSLNVLIVILLLCVSSVVCAQNEASNWYFGDNAGIRFQPNGTITPNNGKLATDEGCASISDSNGNLLFYTDGITVYDRNNTPMPNGFGLYGDPSSTQSAIIIPKPLDNDIYYIFTVDTRISQEDLDFGFNYSEVDMRENGGLGDVIVKNVNLLQDSSEKISAVLKDCDSKSIWVVTLASQSGLPSASGNAFNTFHAFEVTAVGGVNPVAQTSTAGLTTPEQRGYLKFSPDGTKLAVANVRDGLYVYDFDLENGVVTSAPLPLQINATNGAIYPYGLEFSPNGQFLYVSSSNDYFNQNDPSQNETPVNHFSSLVQFNVTASDVQSSATVLDQRNSYRSALQLGPDFRIYRTESATYLQGLPFLSVINNPNASGIASGFQYNTVPLTANARQGLPPFITSFFSETIDIINNPAFSSNFLPLCDGDTYTLEADNIPGATYTWYYNGVEQTTSPTTPNQFDIFINQNGIYEVFVESTVGDCIQLRGRAEVEYALPPPEINTTLFQCDIDRPDGFTSFNLTEANNAVTGGAPNLSVVYYLDEADADAEINPVNATDFQNNTTSQIIARVTNTTTNCFSFSTVTLSGTTTTATNAYLGICDTDGIEDGFVSFNLSDADTQVLEGLPVNYTTAYYQTLDDAHLENNPLPNAYVNTTQTLQTIYVRVENNNACYGINEVILEVLPLPNIETQLETLYCLNTFPDTITLTSGVINDIPNNYYYDWSTGETSKEILINAPGTYTVNVTTVFGCTKERTITVLPSNIATIENIEITDAVENNSITILVSGEGNYEYALNNQNLSYQDSNVFNPLPSGIYTVYVRDKNGCGITEEQISVIGFPKFFTPNGDSQNDYWQVKGVSDQFQSGALIRIFNKYGKLLAQIDPKGSGWDGTYNGNPLPNNDYWFTVLLEDGRQFASHFSLRR